MNEERKEISTEEILCQQLELLAQRSKNCTDEELPSLTKAMISIVAYLSSSDLSVL